MAKKDGSRFHVCVRGGVLLATLHNATCDCSQAPSSAMVVATYLMVDGFVPYYRRVDFERQHPHKYPTKPSSP